jgi:DNA polymerase
MTGTPDVIDRERLASIWRQHLRTDQLLGLSFLPLATPAPQQSEDLPEPASGDGSAAAEPPPAADKAARLEELRRRHDATCPHCAEATGHTRTVFGEGDPDANIMFIGEAPGEEEDRTGRPFVGRAGRKLDEIITAMGLRREQVYIANILKSRPPNNRTPLQHEVERCAPFLSEQIEIIQPRAIVALGGPSAKFLLETTVGITRLRGQWGEYAAHGLAVPVMPTFHPAYLLRNYTQDTRRKVWSDMQAVLARVA